MKKILSLFVLTLFGFMACSAVTLTVKKSNRLSDEYKTFVQVKANGMESDIQKIEVGNPFTIELNEGQDVEVIAQMYVKAQEGMIGLSGLSEETYYLGNIYKDMTLEITTKDGELAILPD